MEVNVLCSHTLVNQKVRERSFVKKESEKVRKKRDVEKTQTQVSTKRINKITY